MSRKKSPPTAGVILIGNELLSGQTQDRNLAYIGEQLQKQGILLQEARIIPDLLDVIVTTTRTFHQAYDLVFTTGGIGPTHDDITSEAMAQAFDRDLELNLEALQCFGPQDGDVIPEGHQRMSTLPKGVTLLKNSVSRAPGFKIENVFVLAGVPEIMRSMFDNLKDSLPQGQNILSKTVFINIREGLLAAPLAQIQGCFPELEIGSYPLWDQQEGGVNIVVKGYNPKAHQEAVEKIEKIEAKLKRIH